jgi:hypothetical protein
VEGVTEPNEINIQLAYVLKVWKNAGLMMDRIGVTQEVLSQKEEGEKKIMTGYYEAAGEVVKSGMSAQAVNIEIKLLSTIRDLMIMLNKSTDEGQKQKLLDILNKADIGNKEFDMLSYSLKVSKAVNRNTIVKTLGEVRAERGEKDFIIDVDALKKAIETKTKTSEAIINFFSGKGKPEDILPRLGGGELKENARGTQMTPMMIHAVAASA